MFTFAKRLFPTVLGGLIAWNLVASFASAQPVPRFRGAGLPTVGGLAGDITTLGTALGTWPGLRPGELPQTSNSNQNLNHAYTNFDVAEVIRALGEYEYDIQRARLVAHDQIKWAKIRNRRQEFYDWLERLSMTPSREWFRERERRLSVEHMLNLPLDEVPSDITLNILLDDLQKLQNLGTPGPKVDLDQELLQFINVTPGNRIGSIDVLKNGSDLAWPVAIQGSEFQSQRELFGSLIHSAVGEAAKGQVDAEVIEKMNGAVQTIRLQLAAKIETIPNGQYVQTTRFLTRLDDAVRVLRQPDVAYYFNGKYSAHGRTVAELVQNMTAKGLKFGPAGDDQAAYLALHNALVAYNVGSHKHGGDGLKSAKQVAMRPATRLSE
jgi:hypothetical protein